MRYDTSDEPAEIDPASTTPGATPSPGRTFAAYRRAAEWVRERTAEPPSGVGS